MHGFDKSELTKKEERLKNKVQSEISYCSYCQSYDGGDIVWIYGKRIELTELFYKCNVPEEYWDNIIGHLYCPSCQNSSLDIGMDVGTKTTYEKDIEKHMDEVYGLYGSDVRELEDLLESYPLLAYKNKLAKRIYKEIKEKILPKTSIKGNFYRARKVENSEVISSNKMFNAPIGRQGEGRFNHSGQSHLYMASDKKTSIKEVTSEKKSILVWNQEFKISTEVNDILDLSFDWSNLTPSTSTLLLSLKVFDSIGRTDRNLYNWNPDYFLTRYIMDCAKSLGYNGIRYNSVKESNAFNIVLFYPDKIDIKPIGNPCIEVFLDEKDKDRFSLELF